METLDEFSTIDKSQKKLSHLSIIAEEPEILKTSQIPLKKLETNSNLHNKSLLNDNNFCNEKVTKPKSRKRNPENWKQNVRKRNKNKGLEYIRANGEICEKKKLGPPCSCKEKCFLKIGKDACEKIFQNFWKLGDHSLQNAYIAGCVRIFLPKNCYKKDGIPSRRFFSRNFHVTVNGIDTEVCKQAFLNMHAISNGRLDRLLKKKQEIGNTGFDERGRHSNKVNKIPIEKIYLVRKHIDSIRNRAGYVGKRKSKKVEILPGLLNIRTMYKLYKEEMLRKGLEPVCEYRYRKIFHTDFRLYFGKGVTLNNESYPPKKNKQLQILTQKSHNEFSSHSDVVIKVPLEKVLNKECQTVCNNKKVETLPNIATQDFDENVQINENLKTNKQESAFSQQDIQIQKDFNERSLDPTLYALSQEVFRLDQTTYNSLQQGWIFPNHN